MAERIRLYFATDVHGSEKCFRKFLNGAAAYKADVLILGGDIAGKALQAIVRENGRYRCEFRGRAYEVSSESELRDLEQLISDHGYYPYRADPGELETRVADGSIERLLDQLMTDRLTRWLELAANRLGPSGIPAYWMLGNDDPPALASALDRGAYGLNAEGKVLDLGGHDLLSWGWSNITPWHSHREMPEAQLAQTLEKLAGTLADPAAAVFNLHVPPISSGLDEAPVLDTELRVQTSAGQIRMGAVGSTAVRELIEHHQPLVSLHGHVHESAGFRKIGRTIAINPGSDYGTGTLNGVLVNLDRRALKSHQFVRG